MRPLAAAAVGLGALVASAALAARALEPPDPLTQAVADGCGRDDAAAIQNRIPEWVSVGDRHFPVAGPPPPHRWLKGVVNGSGSEAYLATHTAGGDIPTTHQSYDVNINVLPEVGFADLLGGDVEQKTGNHAGEAGEAGRVHTELEERALPRFAWPEPGDRVEMLGAWVWDCGHWDGGERTEIHPIKALWVERTPSPRSPTGENEGDLLITTVKTGAGRVADCAHRTREVRAAFRECLASEPDWHDVAGTYRFFLRAPPRPSAGARLTARVLDAGSTANAPPLRLVRSARGVTATVTIPPSAAPSPRRLVLARRVLVGWTPTPRLARPIHLRVRFESILIRRKMDPACPLDRPQCPNAGQSTQHGQTTEGAGEWNVYWDVGGIWGMWNPRVLRVSRDGQVFRSRQTVDVFVRPNQPWRVLIWARECDWSAFSGESTGRPMWPCPRANEVGVRAGDDVPGAALARFRGVRGALGRRHLDGTRRERSTCPRSNRRGCYRVTYTVGVVRSR